MNDPIFLGPSAGGWTALATVVMALAAVASAWVGYQLRADQGKLADMQQRLIELQKRANWLNGALESHSEAMLRLRAEELGKKVVWWDPTNDGPVKKRAPVSTVHGESAVADTVYIFVPEQSRRYPDVT